MAIDRGLLGLFQFLCTTGPEAPELGEKVQMLDQYRRRRNIDKRQLELEMLQRLIAAHETIAAERQTIAKLSEHVETLTAEPWHTGLFVRAVDTARGTRAEVDVGGRRVVGLGTGIDIRELATGTEVFLNNERNVILERAARGTYTLGDAALVSRRLDEERLLIHGPDTEVVVMASDAVRDVEPGDTVRVHRGAVALALEKMQIEDRLGVVEDIAAVDASQIGGFDAHGIIASFTRSIAHRDAAARYGVGENRTVLLYGPPGCGKTTTMRAIASELTRLTGKQCRIFTVNGAELEGSLVGSTQKRIKRIFRNANAYDGPAIIFLDEAESIGRIRGDINGHLSDKFLATWLAEMDGMAPRRQVAIVAATNRKDLLDPAFRERLSGMEVHVRRPRREAAGEIFRIHLPADAPYRPNSGEAPATRDALVALGVTRLYAPNADNGIATIHFRDGNQRTVTAPELVSGRLIRQICVAARERAFTREVDGGEPGVCIDDMEAALEQTIERLRRDLSRQNVHGYLEDLPPGIDIVSVTGLPSRKTQRYHVTPGAAA